MKPEAGQVFDQVRKLCRDEPYMFVDQTFGGKEEARGRAAIENK
ncbi:MAG: hypothetical protein ACR2L2_06375 [Acidobacteriota bacterium]